MATGYGCLGYRVPDDTIVDICVMLILLRWLIHVSILFDL
jgi:hypothetical protein